MKFELKNFKMFNGKIGIYKISIEDHIYIGSSKNLRNRLRYHYHALQKGLHFNPKFQACYDKYVENCQFEIAEYCELELLLQRETHYIQYFNADINIIKDPTNIIWTSESTKKLTNSLKEYYKTHKPVNEKPVHMYSLDGRYITSYRNLTEASRIHHIEPSDISYAIKRNLCSVGFQWSYELKEFLPKSTKNYQKIRQINCTTFEIKSWNSIYEAAYELQIDSHLIKTAIKNKSVLLNSNWKKLNSFYSKTKGGMKSCWT